MPTLPNPKHELFAQALAKGKTQAESYEAAGYAPSEQHASRLARNGKVSERVAELQSKAAAKTEVTIETINKKLQAAFAIGLKHEQSAAMTTAAMAQAKLYGLVIDRSLVANVTLEDALRELDGNGRG